MQKQIIAQSDAKFYPGNQTLLFLGQDLGAIGGFAAPDDSGYYEKVGVVAAGITTYTSVNANNAIFKIDNWGSGNSCASCIVNNPIYKNSVLAIGYYMVNQLDSVNSGEHDDKILELANWVKSTNRPVFLRIGYEFDGVWNSYNPEKYKLAFKRIVDKFRAENVENCAFVWQSSGANDSTFLMKWYPGDDYVDWVAYSHFDYNGLGLLKIARGHQKPVMIAEATPKRTLSVGDGQQHWNLWFKPFFKHIHDNSDIIKAVAYINVNWNIQPLWKGQGWGDSRLEANAVVKQNWLNEIQTDFWLQASDTLFSKLNFIPTSVNHDYKKSNITLYPNPCTEGSFVYFKEESEMDYLQIFSSEGIEIKKCDLKNNKSNKIDVSQLPTGLYFFTFTFSQGQKSIFRLVKSL